MSDYSEVVYVIGAMVIFGLLSLNVMRFIQINEQFQYQSVIEYDAINVAKNTIEEIRWINDPNRFDSGETSFIENDYPQTIDWEIENGSGQSLQFDVNVDIRDTTITGSNANNHIIEVQVTNQYLPNGRVIKMQYIKSFAN